MIKRFILIFPVFISFLNLLTAQDPAHSDSPCSANLFCSQSRLNGYVNTIQSPDPTKIPYPKPRGFCGEVDGPTWFRFVAETPTLELRFTYLNCGLGTSGFQTAIFSTSDCKDTAAFTLVSNCISLTAATGTGDLLATGLVDGQSYYLLIDGFSGSQCDYNISVLQGNIKTVSLGNLTMPTAIYGPTEICDMSNSVVYSIPKNPAATSYNIQVSINGNPPVGGIQPDSFFRLNTTFPSTGTARITANYVNNCTTGAARTLDATIGSSTNIELPPITLSFGQSVTVADSLFEYGSTPLTSTVTQEVYFSRPDATFSGCDTNYHITVTKLARTSGGRAYFIKPGESITIGGTTYTVTAGNCTPILASSGDTIYNAVQSYAFSPAIANLNCNSVRINVLASNACTNVRHSTTNSWYTTDAAGNLFLYGIGNSQLTSTADSFVVVIRDSVIVNGKPESGYRIFYDTIRIRVAGVGSADRPAQPTIISGNNTVCQGSIQTYSLASMPPKADSLSWSILRGGGTILSGQGTRTITVLWLGSSTRDTVRVVGVNACYESIPRDLVVDIASFPNLSAGTDQSLCGLTTNLNAVSGGGNGVWSNAVGNPGIGAFQNQNQVSTPVVVPIAGVYRFVWTETKGTCTFSDTVSVTFSPTPQVTPSSLSDSCNATRTLAFVRFGITGGSDPVNVYFGGTTNVAGTVTNGQFQSVGFIPGAYSFDIRDAQNCSATTIQGTQNCASCTTNAGSMQASTLSVCEGDSARAVFLGGATLEPDDTLQFVLHTSDPKTGILARNSSPVFGFRTGMTYGTVYYISAIAGNAVSGNVDVNDACFSASGARQVQVVFNAKPTATMAVVDSNLCVGSCAVVNFTFTGRSPYTVRAKISDPLTRDTTWGFINNTGSISYCPPVSSSFQLFSIQDANNCIDSVTLNRRVNFIVTNPVNAGLDTMLTVCRGIDTTVALNAILRGEDVGGIWTEVSTIPSTGGAFNAIPGSFRTRNQAAGTYRFRYIITPVPGSACPSDTSIVTINIQSTPIADAGLDETINCFNPIVQIGGNTPEGSGITISWSSLSGRFGGNAPKQEVSQADTYIITATINGCSTRDSVLVSIDTIAPIAIISPINDSLTCRRDTIALDGSNSSPAGIAYLWAYNGVPFDASPTTLAAFGGTYELGVIKLSNGCIATDSIVVRENRILPTVTIEPPKKLDCRDTIVTLNALASSRGADYTFTWASSERGHFVADSTTLEPKVDSAGLYKLVITDSRNGCADSTNVRVIREVDVPVANIFSSDSLDCYNPTVSLSARGSSLGVGLTYEWIANPGRIVSGEATLNAVVDEPGEYFFIVRNERTGCAAIDSIDVYRNENKPQSINFTPRVPACYGDQNGSISINATNGGTAPFVYSLDGKVFTQRTVFSNLSAGQYKLYVQDAGGCVLDTVFNLVQNRQLGVSLGLDTIIKLGDSLLLTAGVNTPNVRRVVWSAYSDSTCRRDSSCLQQWVKPVRQTTYRVVVTDTEGCTAESSVTVSINKQRPVFVPEAFSPNNDGNNDIFIVHGSQVVKIIKRFEIFDRWGERMVSYQNFKTDDPAFGWDGKFQGRDALSGVYPYFVEVEYLDGAIDVIEGSVMLVR